MPSGFVQISRTRWSPATARSSPTGVTSVLLLATVQVAVAGLGSVKPDGSVARTSKVYVPSARSEYVRGDAQALKASRLRRHSKVEPASLELKVKVADVLDVVPVGPDVIVVCGATESILQV